MTWLLVFLITWPLAGKTYTARNSLHDTTVDHTDYNVLNLDLISFVRTDHSTCFGLGWHRLNHAGMDIYVDGGTKDKPAMAVKAGTVVYADPDIFDAWVIDLHDGFYAVYQHIESSLVVSSTVREGAEVGRVLPQTHTGRFPQFRQNADDSHLHFEVRDFLDGSNLFPEYPMCNGFPSGIGYTYPDQPDNYGYFDPIDYVSSRFYLPVIANAYSGPTTSTATVNCNLTNGNFDRSTTGKDGRDPAPWIEIATAEPPNYGFVTDTANSLPYAALLGAIAPATTYEIVDEELVQTFTVTGIVKTLAVQQKLQRSSVLDADDTFRVQVKDGGSQTILGEHTIPMSSLSTNWNDYTVNFSLPGYTGKLSLSYGHISDKDDQNTQLRIDDVSINCS